MSNKNTAEFKVNLIGNIAQRARSFADAIKGMGEKGSRSMRLFSATVNGTNKVIDKFDNKLAGMITGGGFAMVAKNVANQQQILTELGTRYNLTADQVNQLNNAVWQTAGNKKVPYAELLKATDAFLEKTNSYDGVVEQLDNIALSMRAIGLESQNAGSTLGVLFNKGTQSADKMLTVLDGIKSTTKSGSGNINEQLAGLINLTHGTNWQQPEQLMQLLKMQRLSASEFGSDGQSASALQSMFEAIKDPQKQRLLRRNGIEVFADKKTGQFKNPADLLLEIGDKAKYKERNLDDVFSGDMLKMSMLFSDKTKQQQLKSNDLVDGIVSDAALANVQTFNGSMTSLINAGERFAQLNLAKPIQELADIINELSPEELQNYANTIKNIGIGIGGIVVARKAYRAGKALTDVFKGSKAKGVSSVLGGGESLGAVPVYVTNWEGNAGGNNGGGDFLNFGKKYANVAKSLSIYGQLYDVLDDPWQGGTAEEWKQGIVDKANDRYNELSQDDAYKDSGRQRKYDVAPWFDNFLQGREERLDLVNDGAAASASGKTIDEYRRDQAESQQKLVAEFTQSMQDAISRSMSEVTIKIEATDGLKVKSTNINTTGNVDLNVKTGNTYGGAY